MNWFDPIVKILGDFNPLKFDTIHRLTLEFEYYPDPCLNINILAAYGSMHFIQFRICNAKQLRIGEIDHSRLQLGELFIDSLEGHGLERVNYQIHDELGALSCYCEQLEVVSIIERNDVGFEKVVWSNDSSV
jgi:hypothetical protein